MDRNTNQMLFDILRSVVCGKQSDKAENINLSAEQLSTIYNTAKKHDIEQIVSYGIKQLGIILDDNSLIEKSIFKAVYRYENITYAYKNLCDSLEASSIPFLPLKGSVIRNFYPEPWMRTSCDIDILIHEEDCEKAVEILVNNYGYKYSEKGSHDISMFAPNNIHIELHYDLVEERHSNSHFETEVLNTVWETAVLKEGYNCMYEMPDEMFYFYHIAHMAKHFEQGGCGIRSFIDLWILDNLKNKDHSKRDELLKKGKLLKFAECARKLSRVWFDNEEADSVTLRMEAYILSGGAYGVLENLIILQQQKKGGRMKYALSKIFLSYDIIKYYYPILQKHRWLTPIMEVRRWCKLVFCGHAKRTLNELKYNQSISAEKAEEVSKFLTDVGLK